VKTWMVNHGEDCLAQKDPMAFLEETVVGRHFGLWITQTRLHWMALRPLTVFATRARGYE
jgi:hypothetical protein